jgi:hypothetical protein
MIFEPNGMSLQIRELARTFKPCARSNESSRDLNGR